MSSSGMMYHIIITRCLGRVTKVRLCFPQLSVMTWCHIILNSWGQANRSEAAEPNPFRSRSSRCPLLRAGWKSWRKVVCCCRSLRRWEAGSPRLKYWWMMINSCERLKLIQTLLQSDTTVANGDKLFTFTVTWEWTVFSQESGGFVFHFIKAELKLAQTGRRLCRAGLRAWPLLSWRWCTVLGNLFITLRFLLYVSSIFHDGGVNHQQHPVPPVMNGWTCSSICAVVPRGRSHRGAGVTAADEPQQDKRGLQHQQLWLVWNFLNVFLGSCWEASLSMGRTLFCVFYSEPWAWHSWLPSFYTYGCVHVTPAITTIPTHQSSHLE